MNDTITVAGIVASNPRHVETSEHLHISVFRLASPERRYDTDTSTWVDAGTNWYTISTFRQLAQNTESSVSKGDRVIVTGRLRIRSWENDGNTGTAIEIDAAALGHDLAWGTTSYTKNPRQADTADTEPATKDQPF